VRCKVVDSQLHTFLPSSCAGVFKLLIYLLLPQNLSDLVLVRKEGGCVGMRQGGLGRACGLNTSLTLLPTVLRLYFLLNVWEHRTWPRTYYDVLANASRLVDEVRAEAKSLVDGRNASPHPPFSSAGLFSAYFHALLVNYTISLLNCSRRCVWVLRVDK
jgi:hypothetical protein